MPPKPTVNKEDILSAAVALIREGGPQALNARSLAKALGCSTRPLFRVYKNMEELKNGVRVKLDACYDAFMASRMTEENRLLSQAIAYVEFARQERNIFSALFMDKTMAGSSLRDIIYAKWNRASIENAQKVTGVTIETAEMLFLNIWLYSHGMAAQMVSNDIAIPSATVERLLTNAFTRFALELPGLS